MEDLLKIPGVLDRMVEAKLMPPVTASSVPIIPVQEITPTTPVVAVTQAPEIIVPAINSIAPKKGGKWVYWVGGAIVLGYIFRHEIGYYIFKKPNKKYPGN